jgi:hypothetical protein
LNAISSDKWSAEGFSIPLSAFCKAVLGLGNAALLFRSSFAQSRDRLFGDHSLVALIRLSDFDHCGGD